MEQIFPCNGMPLIERSARGLPCLDEFEHFVYLVILCHCVVGTKWLGMGAREIGTIWAAGVEPASAGRRDQLTALMAASAARSVASLDPLARRTRRGTALGCLTR